jgi:Flp pilus assembly protein TadB
MSRTRKARRRDERTRSKRRPATGSMSPATRLALIVGGIACVLGGIALLVAGGPGTAARLGRVAGILIVIGVVASIAAALGHL